MKKIKVAGVPEHFNLPWHLCIENGEFEAVGLDVEWTDVPEGSGKMCELLATNKVDVAVILTEAIVKYLHENPIAQIVQTYVKSPLYWGIHVASQSKLKELSDLKTQKAAISRFGSGSHLMSFVMADQQGWDTKALEFEIVHHLQGAVDKLTQDNAHYFLWEQWMTKPLVDKEVFRKIGTLPTPWPCFVIAVRKDFLTENSAAIQSMLEVINTTTEEFACIPSMDRTIAARYELPLEDVKAWLHKTQWSSDVISKKQYQTVVDYLLKLQLISSSKNYEELIKKM